MGQPLLLLDICDRLESFAPVCLAEDWDNVGLLLGDPQQEIQRVMTCLTISPDIVDEAIKSQAQLVVTHHPLPFRAMKKITTQTIAGEMILRLIQSGIAVYSPHTAFDSAREGINQQLAEGLKLTRIAPLIQRSESSAEIGIGSGRFGEITEGPMELARVVETVKQFLGINSLHIVGDGLKSIHRIAVACGAAGEFMSTALEKGCDCLLLGETNFHTCLEARSNGLALILTGHYASERFAVEKLAHWLSQQYSEVTCWASREESDPVRWIS
ncbi:MAG: Nif3-like dinuclear metal center hexameric protein [Blastopirellula sp.]|nr:MAG: Nif3-like dinuclear metal center hexameric protein [Blastopirellula sp.]